MDSGAGRCGCFAESTFIVKALEQVKRSIWKSRPNKAADIHTEERTHEDPDCGHIARFLDRVIDGMRAEFFSGGRA
jgi:hypothetical protein